MRKFTFLRPIVAAIVAVFFISATLNAQVTGVKTIPGDYASLQAAVTDLNTNGVGVGGATINVAAGYTETLTAALVLTIATNTPSATRPLTIKKNGAGANPLITAFTPGASTALDALFVLDGVDYTTIDGINIQENAANTTPTQQMEFGYALLKINGTNGCQYNTIKNCVVTLNKANTASIGIYSANHTTAAVTALTVTSFAGTNSYNKFYNNTVQNCYGGYAINGFAASAPFDFYDQRNEIGVDGVSASPSQVLDFGGGSATVNGIATTNQNAVKIFNTTITNGNTSSTSTMNGILSGNATNAFVDIYNNTVTLGCGATTTNLIGINNTAGGTGAGNTVNIYNNTVTNCTYTTSTSGLFRGISSSATASYTNMYNNTVSNNTLPGTGEFSAIHYSGSSATLCLLVNINGNTISGNSKTGTGGAFYCISASASTNTTKCYNNQLFNNSNTNSSAVTTGYFNFGFGLNEQIYDNTIYNLTGGSGDVCALDVRSGSGPTNKEVYGNTIYGISGNTSTAIVGAIRIDYATIANCYKNNVYNITNNTTAGQQGAAYGIQIAGVSSVNTLVTTYNNFISEIKAPNASNVDAVFGLWLVGSTASYLNAYYNTVYLNATSTGTNFGTAAIFCSSNPIGVDLRNNIFVNASTANGTGLTRGLARAAAALTNYATTSGNNCIFAGTPSASNLIFSDGTNNDQTLQAFKNRVGASEQSSFSILPSFINVTTSPYNLRINAAVASQIESGAQAISGYTTDFDGLTRNTTTPDVGADELAGTMSDIASPNIQYTTLTNSGVATSRTLTSFATITDPSGINVTPGTRPRLYFKKSTHANTFNTNTNATDGWKWVEASNTSSPFSFTINYSLLSGGSVTAADIIQYFVTAQDLNGTPRIGLNNGGFTTQPTSVNLAAAQFPLNNTINQYTIVANTYSGTINVGPTETITSLTNAGGIFNLINTGVLTGNLTINITGDLTSEAGTNALNQWAEEGAGNYTVTIRPSAATTRLISGSSAAAALIRLDGADRVTIDGRFGGSGNYLTFRNTSTAAPVISFINDAQNNTLTYSIIESGNTATSTTLGGAILIGTTTGLNGNDNNAITYCDIRDRSDVAGTPAMGINCVGTVTLLSQYNDNCTISNNTIHDWYLQNSTSQFALNIGVGNSTFTINSNSFYQTATRTHTVSGAATRAINISFTSTVNSNGGFIITNNFIGGTAPNGGGGDMTLTVSGAGVTQLFTGMNIVTGQIPNSIQNNTITKIDYTTNAPTANTTMFTAISFGQGIHNIGNITGNTIGAATGNDAIKLTFNTGGSSSTFLAGIFCSAVNGYYNVQNNTIGSITIGGTATSPFIPQWIQLQGTPSQDCIISNNLIGSTTTANSIRNIATAAPVISFAIRQLITSGAGLVLNNNSIQNISDASTAASSISYGVLLISTVGGQGTLTVTNNIIKDVVSAASVVAPTITNFGIAVQGFGGLTHDISLNKISGLANTSAGAFANYVVGIQTQGSSLGGTITRNNIWDLRNANTSATAAIAGVYISAGLNWTLNNNRISINNNNATSDMNVWGITELMAANSSFAMNYNSVYVGGTASGSLNTMAYNHGSNATVSLRNNLLFNERSGGTGNHVAIASSSATPSIGWNTSTNNAFVSANAATVGLWNTTANDFATWKTNSGADVNSVADVSSNVTANNLFINAATGNLRINTSTFPAGLATPIGSVTIDFDGDARSATTPTIGSDEVPFTSLPVSLTNVKAYQQNSGITVEWNTQSESGMQQYEVEKSANGTNFVKVNTTAAKSGTTNSYKFFDATPFSGANYYRIKAISLNGEVKYSSIVVVRLNTKGTKVTLYPNPVKGSTIQLQLSNLEKGNYSVTLFNQLGQQVMSKTINHNGGSSNQTVNIGNIPSGLYELRLSNGQAVITQKLIKE